MRKRRQAKSEQGILNGRYDVGLAFDPPEHEQLAVAPLFDEHLVFVCSRSSRHANRKAIELRQLSNIPLALLTQAFATRRLLDAATEGKATLDVQIEMNSVEALLELARRNIAPTIIANRSLAARTDAALPLTSHPNYWSRRRLAVGRHSLSDEGDKGLPRHRAAGTHENALAQGSTMNG